MAESLEKRFGDVLAVDQVSSSVRDGGVFGFLTTNYIEEAERLCARTAFIVQGRIVRVDALAALLRNVEGQRIVQLAPSHDAEPLLAPLQEAFPHGRFEAMLDGALRARTSEALPLAPL